MKSIQQIYENLSRERTMKAARETTSVRCLMSHVSHEQRSKNMLEVLLI
ncbi:hypothetical protein [Ktedonospora formicarum]|nr:hypothetical protein [Ktedonospora formicarum]